MALSLLVVLLTVHLSVGSFGSAAGQGQVMSAFGVGCLKGWLSVLLIILCNEMGM